MLPLVSVISGLGGRDCLHCLWMVGAMVPLLFVISPLGGFA